MARKRARWLILLGASGVAGYVAVMGGDYSALDVRRARQEVAERQAELELLKLETDSLEARAEALRNDPDALEWIARERYGMVREGELLYRLVEPHDSTGAVSERPPEDRR